MRKNLPNLSNLSQLLCLSVVKLLCKQALSPKIKWPNDILVNKKKISGTMCEVIDLREVYGILAGTGINVNMSQEKLNLIDQPATSFLREMGKTFSLAPLLSLLDQFFVEDLALYRVEGFQPFYQMYDSFLMYKQQRITLYQNKNALKGTFDSLNLDGSLNLILDSGEIKSIHSGDISSKKQRS